MAFDLPLGNANQLLDANGLTWAQNLLHRKSFGPINNIIDLGCGSGTSTARLLELFPEAHAIGVDADFPRPGERTFSFVPDGQARAELMQGDFHYMPFFADNSADLIYMRAAWHYVEPPNRNLVVSEIARILRPGGHFIIHEPFSDLPTNHPFTPYENGANNRLTKESHPTFKETTEAIRECGLIPVGIRTANERFSSGSEFVDRFRLSLENYAHLMAPDELDAAFESLETLASKEITDTICIPHPLVLFRKPPSH